MTATLRHHRKRDRAVKVTHPRPQHLAVRGAQISAEFVRQLRTEGIYPLDDQPTTAPSP
jgi:hypothetical protein